VSECGFDFRHLGGTECAQAIRVKPFGSGVSSQHSPRIMRPASLSLRQEIAFRDEFFQAQLHGARLAFRECHNLADGEGFVIGEKGDDLFRERVEVFGAGFPEGECPCRWSKALQLVIGG
jgi:hypothetical protein